MEKLNNLNKKSSSIQPGSEVTFKSDGKVPIELGNKTPYLSSSKASDKFKKSKKITLPPQNDFAFPIYIQRRQTLGVTVTSPDMNITRTLPLPQNYEKSSDFYYDLIVTLMEVDSLAIAEFKKRDLESTKKHRESLFPRGLNDHLNVNLDLLKFKPSLASRLTTKSERTWQAWCKQKLVKTNPRKKNKLRHHYLIPFLELAPFLKEEFAANPSLILSFIKK